MGNYLLERLKRLLVTTPAGRSAFQASLDLERAQAPRSEEERPGLMSRPLRERDWSKADWVAAVREPEIVRRALDTLDLAADRKIWLGRLLASRLDAVIRVGQYSETYHLEPLTRLLVRLDHETDRLAAEVQAVLAHALSIHRKDERTIHEKNIATTLSGALARSKRLSADAAIAFATNANHRGPELLYALVENGSLDDATLVVALKAAPFPVRRPFAESFARAVAEAGRRDVLIHLMNASNPLMRRPAYVHAPAGLFRQLVLEWSPEPTQHSASWWVRAARDRIEAGAPVDLPDDRALHAVAEAAAQGVPLGKALSVLSQEPETVVTALLDHPDRAVRMAAIQKLPDVQPPTADAEGRRQDASRRDPSPGAGSDRAREDTGRSPVRQPPVR